MNNKYIRAMITGVTTILIIGSVFTSVPVGYAQSLQNWSDPMNLSNAGSSTNPAIVIDSTGTIHVIWFDRFDGYKYTKSTDGMNWTPPETVKFPFSPASLVSSENILQPEAPVLLADGSGGIHAFWRDDTNTLFYSRVASGFDLASNWTSSMKLADSVVDFDAVISSQGVVHVGYVSNLGTNKNPVGVFYRQLVGNSWSKPQNLYSSQHFRTLKPDEANVRLAVSDDSELETVYMVWDDQTQRQILMSKSLDGGNLWEGAIQIHGSDGSSGQETPHNVNIDVMDSQVLVLWQDGQPGSQCIQYSQLSTDGGEHFAPPEKILDEIVGCTQTSHFIKVNKDFSVVSLRILDTISLLAWNGSHWSKPQNQNEVTSFVNPVTFDSVIFGCQQISSYKGQLFVVGCDNGNGGDIWFSSRLSGDVEIWFPPVTAWTVPTEITHVNQQISDLSLVSDNENNIHAFWVQAQLLSGNKEIPTIQHAEWNDNGWSNPATIISGMDGRPSQLKAHMGNPKRLLLTWIDGNTGEIFFSWAGSDRANIASEWVIPQIIPSTSQVNSSPDPLIDDAGKIIIAYAVPINEQRGIYFVESDDSGTTWTKPVQIFDAVAAGWDVVDQPNISLTGDGQLHILFNRYSAQGESRRSQGLYYSQSANGGTTWTDPKAVSEQSVQWSDLVAYGKSNLYRLWQEYRQSELVSFHQISQDGGVTWSSPLIVSSINASTSPTGQITDEAGNLYFLQLTGKDNLTLLSNVWNGSSWVSQEPRELYIKDRGVPSSITVGVSSKGNLLASFLVGYPYSTDKLKSDIFSVNKSIELPEEPSTPFPAIIAVVEPTFGVTEELSNVLQSPTQISTVTDLNNLPSSSSSNKNLVGLFLLSGILVFVVIIFRPIARKKSKQEKKPN